MDGQKEYICKAELRKELSERRKSIADKPLRSQRAGERVLPLLHGNVMVYVSIGSELSTVWLINELLCRGDVIVYAPHTVDGVITPRRLIRLGTVDKLGNLDDSCYGRIDEGAKIDVCVTPMLGFNADGYRIGYGKGCYDRFFSERDVYKIGLAFDAQRVRFLQEAYDVPLDCCVTENGVVYFNK